MGIASREKVVCCRFMMFLERFEHFKDDFGRSYFFVWICHETLDIAAHLVTSSNLEMEFEAGTWWFCSTHSNISKCDDIMLQY